MKKLLIIVLVLMVATFGFSQNTVKKEFKVSKGGTLAVDLKTGGSIEIKGWNKNKVDLVFKVEGRDAEKVRFEADKDGNDVEIISRFLKKKKNYKVKCLLKVMVPEKYDLKLKTMGGRINISGVDGKIGGLTMGGPLDLDHLTGVIKLKTMGGEIVLKDSRVDGIVKTMGGRILLKNVVGEVDGESMGGNVVYQNVRKTKNGSGGRVIKIKSMGGNINLTEAGSGARVHTMGGSIHVKSAEKFIDATTMGGKIKIDAIDGWVKATTMGGDIKVVMVGDPEKGKRDVELKTLGGDVTLYVPKGLSMNFDIELVFTKNSTKTYKIVSDFKISTETSKEWNRSKGTPRKTISGKGKIKGGKHSIKIRNINGNVHIKENK